MTYVLSDIHGNLQRFKSIMAQINLQTNDTLYVLGDVIDRYAGGIKILRQIMRMPNTKMLIGNHEYMMLNAIGHCKDAAEEKENTNRREKRLWYRNGGTITHEQLKHYRKDIRAEIFDFIRQLPTNLEVEVNGIRYKLVHASPEGNYMKSPWNIYDYKSSREFAIWNRWDETQPIPEGYVLIFGHTPTCYFHDKMPCDFSHGKLDFITARIVNPANFFREETVDLLHDNYGYVENSILTDSQRQKVRDKVAF